MNQEASIQCPNGCRMQRSPVKVVQHYGPNRTRLYRCRTCQREFSERRGSVFSGFHTDQKTIYRVLKALAKGNGIRTTARIFDVNRKTVERILERAAAHCQRVSETLIRNYHLTECQLDELWSFVKKRKRISQPLNAWRPSTAISGCGSALTRATKS